MPDLSESPCVPDPGVYSIVEGGEEDEREESSGGEGVEAPEAKEEDDIGGVGPLEVEPQRCLLDQGGDCQEEGGDQHRDEVNQ